MIKRTSLVWKRPELSNADFRRIWLGEHVEYARQLPGILEYTIDFVTEGPEGAPSAIATLRFSSREALEAAFNVPGLRENLLRTREQFASSVQVLIVEESAVVRQQALERATG
jgi:uncharacterized protein (TIGR02118 family)